MILLLDWKFVVCCTFGTPTISCKDAARSSINHGRIVSENRARKPLVPKVCLREAISIRFLQH